MKRTIVYLLFLIPLPGFARTIHVCPDCEVTSIKHAIALAQDGDMVLIHKGLYREGQIVVDKSIVLKGLDFPEIDGGNSTEIITVVANGVTVEGLQVQNVGTSYLEDRAGIRIKKARDFTIRNNRLLNTFFGIYLEHAQQGMVAGNVLAGQAVAEMSSGNAIHLWYCKQVTIEHNQASGHRDGIYLEFADHCQIFGNVSEKNLRYGLHFMFSNDDDYYQNTFRDNGAGVAVMFSKRINMWENVFEFNWGRASYGLLLKEITDAGIRNNTFQENTIGVYVEGSSRISYSQNNFIRNGWAMKVAGGCLDNEVKMNNFLSNTFDLSVNASGGNNRYDGNYWSEYTGYDLDRDGVGDVPFRPVKLFNFVVNQTPEAIVLLRSLFVDLINFSEKVSPVFTPANVLDEKPLMKVVR